MGKKSASYKRRLRHSQKLKKKQKAREQKDSTPGEGVDVNTGEQMSSTTINHLLSDSCFHSSTEPPRLPESRPNIENSIHLAQPSLTASNHAVNMEGTIEVQEKAYTKLRE